MLLNYPKNFQKYIEKSKKLKRLEENSSRQGPM